MDREFFEIAKRITENCEYYKLKSYKHHINTTTYRHSLKVAYLCYLHLKKHGSLEKANTVVRGALLHDYFLYDCHAEDTSRRLHNLRHPKVALKNARKRYPDLTYAEEDMILHHMFPLTPIPPKTRAGWLVCLYDKIATVSDLLDRN
ncbi:MAG: HD domain-containing protein [Clostridia bacterium]|nr:HD domain-containing protein [Clostridia bacterium]